MKRGPPWPRERRAPLPARQRRRRGRAGYALRRARRDGLSGAKMPAVPDAAVAAAGDRAPCAGTVRWLENVADKMNEDGPAAAAAGHPRELEAGRGTGSKSRPVPGTRRRAGPEGTAGRPAFRPADRKINPRSRSVSPAAGDRAADPAGTGTRRACYAGSPARAGRLFACEDVLFKA